VATPPISKRKRLHVDGDSMCCHCDIFYKYI
jgi:hypothetical protein